MQSHRIHLKTGDHPLFDANGKMVGTSRYLEHEYRDGVGFVWAYNPKEQTEEQAMAEFAKYIADPKSQAEAHEAWLKKTHKAA